MLETAGDIIMCCERIGCIPLRVHKSRSRRPARLSCAHRQMGAQISLDEEIAGLECDPMQQEITGFERDPMPHDGRHLRLLMLHGHCSNNDISRMQARHLGLADVHGIQCDFFCASLEASSYDDTLEAFSDKPFYTWFNHWTLSAPKWMQGFLNASNRSGSLRNSLARILHVIRRYGPYDGVYGFSQGGFVAALLLNPVVWRGLLKLEACPFDFAILSCAALGDFLPKCEIVQATGDRRVRLELPYAPSVQTLHLIGRHDPEADEGRRMRTYFDSPVVYTHEGGHEVPARLLNDERLRATLDAFFEQQRRRLAHGSCIEASASAQQVSHAHVMCLPGHDTAEVEGWRSGNVTSCSGSLW